MVIQEQHWHRIKMLNGTLPMKLAGLITQNQINLAIALRATVTAAPILFLLFFAEQSQAFEKLTAAQSLVYETPHLQNTNNGQTLTYNYSADSSEKESVTDHVVLSVSNAGDDGKRDVSLDFLTDERRMILPDFPGYRGNPIIIAMLEHIAQTLGRETGGGVIYFRNRIRDALAAESVRITESELEFNSNKIAATELQFSPFEQDPYLAEMPEYRQSSFTISLSQEVPGGVLGISVESKTDDKVQFYRGIKLDSL